MYRAKVTAVDASGVYVLTAEYGVLGPCQVVGATPDVDDMVLAANVGSDVAPDLVVLSDAAAQYLTVSSAAGEYAGLTVRTDGEPRWFIGKSNAAEPGGDVGSVFIIWAYDDDGVQTLKPFTIYRNTGRIVAGLSGADAGIDLSLNGPRVLHGTGDPNGAYPAPVGSTFHRADGGAGTSFYVKESGGTGDTGWVGK